MSHLSLGQSLHVCTEQLTEGTGPVTQQAAGVGAGAHLLLYQFSGGEGGGVVHCKKAEIYVGLPQ